MAKFSSAPIGQLDDDYEEDNRQYKRLPIAPQAANDQAPVQMAANTGPTPITASVSSPGASPKPVQPAPIGNPKLDADQKELQRLEKTGSGIDQLSKKPGLGHKILSVLGRIGDVAGTALFPTVAAEIPGTTLHHASLEGRQVGRVANDLATQKEKTGIAHEQAETQNLEDQGAKEITPEQQAFNYYTSKGMNPADAFGKIIEAKAGGKTDSPELQAYQSLIKLGHDPVEAFTTIEKAKQKPQGDTAAADDQKYEALLHKQLMGQKLTPEEEATRKAYEQRKTLGTRTTFNLNQGNKGDARSDKSYQYNSGVLDKEGQPIEQAVQRMGRLKDTLAQGTPQADALVAPELLTVMAGGAGSGLRMSEAEIARIVGGRSNWESLQASINKWKLDPSQANSITKDQRNQIHALVEAVNKKLLAKQKVLDDARDKLIDTDDPKGHRNIVNGARKSLTQIDEGGGQAAKDFGEAPPGKADGATGTLPDGTKVKVHGGRLVAL